VSRAGFTLIEILVVIAIAGILLSVATLNFSEYLRRNSVSQQTSEVYTDLMATRNAAVTQRTPKRVIITPTTFTFISSALGSGLSSARAVRTLKNPITWAGKGSATSTDIIFDERGTFNIDVDSNTTICVDPVVDSATLDSIVVFSTRIRTGKRTGANCESGDITIK
jgi:prepilin-type N-terminal cleavage/methylation domain-containing protein